jgi:ribosomal subunit interface protein
MQIQIVSKNIDVSPALHARINERFDEMIDKYIHREGEAHVSVSREGSGFRTVCSVHLPSGATMEATGNAAEAYGATDEALEHMEKRLRRYKRRLKDHHPDVKTAAKAEAFNMFIMKNPVDDSDLDDDENAGSAPPQEPMIISEASQPLRTMTPGMAALELGLADNGVVVFNNVKHGRINIVFKRPDGNIGWIDPKA